MLLVMYKQSTTKLQPYLPLIEYY